MGMRMLPHKDMLGLRSYFLFSTLTLATTMLTIDCPLYLLDAVVMGHHIFCYLTWNQSPQSKKVSIFPEWHWSELTCTFSNKVVLWSSLNWNGSRLQEPILFFGTLFVRLKTRWSVNNFFFRFTGCCKCTCLSWIPFGYKHQIQGNCNGSCNCSKCYHGSIVQFSFSLGNPW